MKKGKDRSAKAFFSVEENAREMVKLAFSELGIDADAVDAGLAEHGQHVRRRRIGTARFDRPFAVSSSFLVTSAFSFSSTSPCVV